MGYFSPLPLPSSRGAKRGKIKIGPGIIRRSTESHDDRLSVRYPSIWICLILLFPSGTRVREEEEEEEDDDLHRKFSVRKGEKKIRKTTRKDIVGR